MTSLLAIDTSSDACSVAWYREGVYAERYETGVRNSSRRLLPMLRDLLPEGDPRSAGIKAVAYGCGPGSFTGLRIAASAVQALCYAWDLPAVPVSTLTCQAQTALRVGAVKAEDTVLSVLDARIGEVYWAVVRYQACSAVLVDVPRVSAPGGIVVSPDYEMLQGIGNGMYYLSQFPEPLRERLESSHPEVLPAARDLIPTALRAFAEGNVQSAAAVSPVYVRDEISWKKLPDQQRR